MARILRNSQRSIGATASRTATRGQTSVSRFARVAKTSRVSKARSVATMWQRQEQTYLQSRSYHVTRRLQYAEAEAKEEAKEAAQEAEGEVSGEDASKLKTELEATKLALEETTKALSEQKERLARVYADLENTVRIAKRDVAHAKEFGIKGFAMKMFDVLDTVELCLQNLPKDAEPDSHLHNAIVALDSTKKQFAKVMADFDVKQMETKVGDKFDANFHNAVFEMNAHAHDTPMQSIGVIIKQGWTRAGNLLRPSHVGVVMRPHPDAKPKE